MSEQQDNDSRPCLHCLMVEMIDEFFAEYPTPTGEPETIDTDEVISAIAKTVAELTSRENGAVRQQIIERLMRDIMKFDAEFRQEDETPVSSGARH
jgi:hypothetical protein